MRWPLRYQILVPFAGTMLTVLVFVSLLNAYLAARSTEQRIDEQLKDVARTLVDSSFPLTETVLRQAHGLSGAEFVLADPKGKVIAASLPAPSAPENKTAGLLRELRLGPAIEFGSERYFHAAVALHTRSGGNGPAVLHILYPERIWREARWQASYPPLMVGLGALVVVSLLAIAVAKRLSRPILQLRSQLERMAEGDFQPVPLPTRKDELADLVGSVNMLAGQLDELQRVIKRSERLSLLGQLSGGLAHHLRNNVTGVRMAVQLHQRQCRQIDQESLRVALRQLAFTEEHLQRFLAAGQPQVPESAACDLVQIVEELLPLVEPACRHRKVDLQCAALDPAPAMIWADREQLGQLLLNLALNAIEAAGAGGWVRIEIARLPGQVALRLLDSGSGPPSELLERLFEPFATGKPEGIGLGLTVARQIAEAHGGSLTFKREKETCFELRLPSASPEDASPKVASPTNIGVNGHSIAADSLPELMTPSVIGEDAE